jgi:post-segregation antitoxin (ccd killing protein)
MQVYLPENLYQAVKELGLPASELLQKAVQSEIRRRQLLDATDAYLKELFEEVGEPGAEDWAWAEAFVDRLKRHPDRAVG